MDHSVLAGEPARIWHVYWQAAVGRDLLSDSELVVRIRSHMLAVHRKLGRQLLYYLLMPTEIHLLTALSAGDSASSLAKGMANVISRWVRGVQGLPGPVFAGPYRAIEIPNAEALCDEVRMLAWRPVEKGLCVAATHYRHSALRIALGNRRPEGFHSAALLGLFGPSVREGRDALRARLAQRPSAPEFLRWELDHSLVLASGSTGSIGLMSHHVRGAAAALVAACGSEGIDGALGLLERWVLAKLRLAAHQSLADGTEHDSARGRALVATLAVRSGLCSAAFVARRFNRARATLSEQMAACRRRPADRLILEIPISRVVREAIDLARQTKPRDANPR